MTKKGLTILVVGRSPYHIAYYGSIIQGLINRGCSVTYIFDKKYEKKAEPVGLTEMRNRLTNFNVKAIVYPKTLRRSLIHLVQNLLTVGSYSLRNRQSSFYIQRWISYLPSLVQYLFKYPFFLRINSFFYKIGMYRFLLDNCMSTKFESGVIAGIRPDFVFISPGNMRFDNEIFFCAAGKKAGITVWNYVLSWDNLSSKGCIPNNSDQLIVWNENHRREAIDFHKIESSKIKIIGSSFFDRLVGVGTKHLEKKQVLYLGSSANIAKDESWLVNAMATYVDKLSLRLFVRPHPSNVRPFIDGILPPALYEENGWGLPDTDEANELLINTFKSSLAVIGINTSAFIDALVLNVPVIAFECEHYEKTQKSAIHFQQLIASNAIYLVRDNFELSRLLNLLKSGIDPLANHRRNFVKDNIFPGCEIGGCGETISDEILRRINDNELLQSPQNI